MALTNFAKRILTKLRESLTIRSKATSSQTPNFNKQLTPLPPTTASVTVNNVGFAIELWDPKDRKTYTDFETTGYFPPGASGYKSKKEALMEGGSKDCLGRPLRTLQDYMPGSYVSIAVDKKVIPLKSVVYIDGYNKDDSPIVFVACDVGGAIKGHHIDICVANEKESFPVTKKNQKVHVVGKVLSF